MQFFVVDLGQSTNGLTIAVIRIVSADHHLVIRCIGQYCWMTPVDYLVVLVLLSVGCDS